MDFSNRYSNNHFKVVILGNSRVGKTSIVCRQLYGYLPTDQRSTIACSSCEIEFNIESSPVSLEVIDTAGTESYHSLIPIYIRGAQAAIFVFDITDPKSFCSIPDWISILQDNVEQCPIIYIVGNKKDLPSGIKVQPEEIQSMAKRYNAIPLQVSALTGEGIDQIFVGIATSLHKTAIATVVRPDTQLTPQKKKECC